MIKRFITIMSLALLLTSSSFFFPEYINSQVENQRLTEQELTLALERDLPTAIRIAHKQSRKGSQKWLYLSRKLAKENSVIALQLANYYSEQHNLVKANYWWQHASKLGNIEANFALMKYHLTQGNFDKAIQVVSRIDNDERATLYQIEIALLQGEALKAIDLVEQLNDKERRNSIKKLLNRYKIGNEPLDKTTYSNIDKHSPSWRYQLIDLSINSNFSTKNNYSVQCRNSVQFFATNLSDLHHVEQLIYQAKSYDITANFCFAPVRYIPLSLLSCQHNEDQVALCDDLALSQINDIESRYLALLLPYGGAKVDHGFMYLDRNDTVKVLTHELSHWLGFIGEYPLPPNHQRCASIQQKPFSHNVVVLHTAASKLTRTELLRQIPWATEIKKSTPLWSDTDYGRLLGTPFEYQDEIGLFVAQTCNNTKVSAYKPVTKRTQLQYFELDFPSQYIELFKNTKHDFSMPSFYYNFALAASNQNRDDQIKKWLIKAELMENSPQRKVKIKAGQF